MSPSSHLGYRDMGRTITGFDNKLLIPNMKWTTQTFLLVMMTKWVLLFGKEYNGLDMLLNWVTGGRQGMENPFVFGKTGGLVEPA